MASFYMWWILVESVCKTLRERQSNHEIRWSFRLLQLESITYVLNYLRVRPNGPGTCVPLTSQISTGGLKQTLFLSGLTRQMTFRGEFSREEVAWTLIHSLVRLIILRLQHLFLEPNTSIHAFTIKRAWLHSGNETLVEESTRSYFLPSASVHVS